MISLNNLISPAKNDPDIQNIIVQPNVPLNTVPISTEKVEVFGIAAFMEIALQRPNVKYTIENGRLRHTDVYKVCNIDMYAPLRTWTGASHEHLNFLDDEIPKFFRWYVWDKYTQAEACKFLKIVIKGLETLKNGVYATEDKKVVQEKLDYWIKIIEIAIEEPIEKDNFTKKLNGLYVSTSYANKIPATSNKLLDKEWNFGLIIKSLITNVQLQQINKIFYGQYPSEQAKINAVEASIDNLYLHFDHQKRCATRQTLSHIEYTLINPHTLPKKD